MVNPSSNDSPTTAIQPVTLHPKKYPQHPTQQVPVEQTQLRDVRLLLESLFDREESTVKLILSHLYDIGAVNLINQRVRSRSFNRLAKWIARFSKPVFRMVALRWFKRNCPRLITNWLYTQVKFEPQQIAEVVQEVEANAALPQSRSQELEYYRREVRQLHSRVKLLTTLLLSLTCTLGGGLIWVLWRQQSQAVEPNRVLPVGLTQQQVRCQPEVTGCY